MVEHVLGKDGVMGSIPISSLSYAKSKRQKAMREIITLECTVCKRRNYTMLKNKKAHPDKLETKKYCRFCRKHTSHKEIK